MSEFEGVMLLGEIGLYTLGVMVVLAPIWVLFIIWKYGTKKNRL